MSWTEDHKKYLDSFVADVNQKIVETGIKILVLEVSTVVRLGYEYQGVRRPIYLEINTLALTWNGAEPLIEEYVEAVVALRSVQLRREHSKVTGLLGNLFTRED